ncbi:hypothetical protein Sjap_011949 [Stephania japonica]|uniref:Uncharacterized protein n=1 Tax=Stephania japonica TaxID=461633 RepID=A0AAP0EXK4_9MAGN
MKGGEVSCGGLKSAQSPTLILRPSLQKKSRERELLGEATSAAAGGGSYRGGGSGSESGDRPHVLTRYPVLLTSHHLFFSSNGCYRFKSLFNLSFTSKHKHHPPSPFDSAPTPPPATNPFDDFHEDKPTSAASWESLATDQLGSRHHHRPQKCGLL